VCRAVVACCMADIWLVAIRQLRAWHDATDLKSRSLRNRLLCRFRIDERRPILAYLLDNLQRAGRIPVNDAGP
jgi:hypothetical protein